MDYSEILKELQQASLFDLYRLRVGMNAILEDPKRLEAIKRRLQPGQEISYFSVKENRLKHGVIMNVNRTWVVVRSKEDGKSWNVPLRAVNLDGVPTDIHAAYGQHKLDRNLLKVGDPIGFYDQKDREQYGTVVQLNQKSVSILTREGIRWRVAYEYVFKVVDGMGNREADVGLIEGEIVIQ